MFEKFTESARRGLYFARYEAVRRGSRLIEPEHALLGILREGERTLLDLLSGLNVKPEDLRNDVEDVVGPVVEPDMVSTNVDLPLSENIKDAFRDTVYEAGVMRHDHVGSEHLILGILHVRNSPAARILQDRRLHFKVVREEIVSMALRSEAG